MKDHIDIVIIGAGVIGLAIARSLALKGKQVLIIEAEKNFGMAISSRNSEVIHAGIYNEPTMLKSSLCIAGKNALYDYVKTRNIGHNQCGKLIVASHNSEVSKLQQIKTNAEQCGVNDLQLLTEKECNSFEPDIKAIAGILSPSSGIINSHDYMLSLLTDVENSSGMVAYNSQVTDIKKTSSGFCITTNNNYQLNCQILINAAGLGAIKIAHMISDLDKNHIPSLYLAKGNYFSYGGKCNFNHLIYPLPEAGGLGIHLTFDMAGAVKFGPDVEFIEHEDYQVTSSSKTKFIEIIKKYYPTIDQSKLNADYAGIRPKISKQGADFGIQFSKDHGVEGLVNLFGIESPGLTASLAIGQHVAEQL